MKHILVGLGLVVLLTGCSSSTTTDETANYGDCPEKTAMLTVQELAEDTAGPGGAKVTKSEFREIRNAIDNVPSDC